MEKDAGKALVMNIDPAELQRNTEMQKALRKRLEQMNHEEVGRVDSLRHAVLNGVVAETYDRARKDLNAYVDLKTEFPEFQKKAARYVKHCMDLIQAVETKRHFPGLAGLSLSKQQEIHERVVGHFNELKQHLVHIEKIEREHKLHDVRSTVWVIRAICHGVGVIMLFAFLLDTAGMFGSANIVFDQMITDILVYISKNYKI